MGIIRYLVGDRRDKRNINSLVYRRLPGILTYDYAYLCKTLHERIVDYDARNMFEVDSCLELYMEDLETDIREVNSAFEVNLAPFLGDVRTSFSYLFDYFDILHLAPNRKGVKIREGTRSSVLTIDVEIDKDYNPFRGNNEAISRLYERHTGNWYGQD